LVTTIFSESITETREALFVFKLIYDQRNCCYVTVLIILHIFFFTLKAGFALIAVYFWRSPLHRNESACVDYLTVLVEIMLLFSIDPESRSVILHVYVGADIGVRGIPENLLQVKLNLECNCAKSNRFNLDFGLRPKHQTRGAANAIFFEKKRECLTDITLFIVNHAFK
jgi:hypothetical protein